MSDSHHKSDDGVTMRSYVIGFVSSVVLTITAYLLVTRSSLQRRSLIAGVICLAIVQFLMQIYYFLHLGRETKPRWRLYTLIAAVVIILILVLGSIWIMYNLNYRMTPSQINQYLNGQSDGI